MKRLSYLLASLVLLAVAAPGVWAADEPAKEPAKKPAAEKKAEPEAKAPAEKEVAPAKKEEAEKKAEPAEAKPAAKPETKPAEKAEAKPAESKAEEKKETYTVKADMLKIDLELDGVFVAQNMTNVELRPESWSSFKVVNAVEHGTQVEKGDILVEFETDKIDEAIADQETAQELAELSLKQAELGLKLLETTTPIDLKMVDRQKKMMAEDLERFLKIEIALTKKSAEYSLKSSEQSLEYELEELNQLEKMYKADDLTEETEEIILKRQRNSVERAKFYVELAKNRFDEIMNVYLPRDKESMEVSSELYQLTLDRAKAVLPMDLQREKIGLEKLRVQQKRDLAQFAKLKEDRKLMTITAPAAGIVYYGKCVRGKWSGASGVAEKLQPGASASTGPLMTIVNPRPLQVRATVAEKDLHWVKKGMRGTVEPTAIPDARIATTLGEIDGVLNVDSAYAATFRVSLNEEMDAIMPGMNCKVKLVPYLKKRTLVIPVKAMQTDELDDTRHYVQLLGDDGRAVKQAVTIGQKKGEIVEILDGLAKGDKILAEYPKDKD
ncbi:MAG: HlyD family efflux transporter periplasmic adaptor subunit [Planctomycetaceae bacterium]|nr:HlyD family efflux transporter periplasmic adaptor subunit [Planctomycetaceae bacterium]